MKCVECGKEIDNNKKFCPYCGAKLVRYRSHQNKVKEKPKKKFNKKIILSIIVIVAIVIGGSVVVSQLNKRNTLSSSQKAYNNVIQQYTDLLTDNTDYDITSTKVMNDYPQVGEAIDIIYSGDEISSVYSAYYDIDNNGQDELLMGYKNQDDSDVNILCIYMYDKDIDTIATVSINGVIHISNNNEIIEEIDKDAVDGAINVITMKKNKLSTATYTRDSKIGTESLSYSALKDTFVSDYSWNLIKSGKSRKSSSSTSDESFTAKYMPSDGEYYNKSDKDAKNLYSIVIKKIDSKSFEFTIYQNNDSSGEALDPAQEIFTTHTATFRSANSKYAYYKGNRYNISLRCSNNTIRISGFSKATQYGSTYKLIEGSNDD